MDVRHRPLLVVMLLLLLLATSLVTTTANADWRRAESPHFVVYGDAGETRLLEYTRRLERFRALLALYYPVDEARPAPHLVVYLVRDLVDFRTAAPGLGARAIGVYIADPSGVRAIVLMSDDYAMSADVVLQHEYTHHFMYQYGNGAMPAWLVEGLAEYFSTANVDGTLARVGTASPGRVGSLVHDTSSMNRIRPRRLPLETVLTASTGELSGDDAVAFYAQSWLMTHYLLRDPERKRQLAGYVRAIRAGADPLEAFPGAFGTDIPTFAGALRQYLRAGMQFSQLEVALPEPVIGVSQMPAGADAMLLRSMGAELLGRPTRDPEVPALRQQFLADMRTRLQRYPGNGYVVERAAATEVSIGDPQRALDLLASTLDDTSSPERLYIAGTAHLGIARARIRAQRGMDEASSAALEKARRYFVLVHKADTLHYRAMYRYWEASRLAGLPLTPALQSVLVQSYNLAPQCTEIALAAGRMLAQLGRKTEAVTVLRAVAGDPHGGNSANYARRLLERLSTPTGANSKSLEALLAEEPLAEDLDGGDGN